MVKVISEGPLGAKQITCSKCTFRLEYTGEDVKLQSFTSSPYSYIVCPRCQQKVIVGVWRLDT